MLLVLFEVHELEISWNGGVNPVTNYSPKERVLNSISGKEGKRHLLSTKLYSTNTCAMILYNKVCTFA